MKRIFLCLLFLFFLSVKSAYACGVSTSPSSTTEGNAVTVTVTPSTSGSHTVTVLHNGTTVANITLNLTSPYVFPLSFTAGEYVVSAIRNGTTETCNGSFRVFTAGSTAISANGVEPPKSWLPDFSTGIGLPAFPMEGISFFTQRFIPFIISLMLFLLIVLSLIFLIIGGIKYMTSGGNKEGVVKAKGTITYALIGLAVGLGAFVIVQMLFSMFNTP